MWIAGCTWRKRRDFGTGTLGDLGCHMFSGWFRAMYLAAPIAVKHTGVGDEVVFQSGDDLVRKTPAFFDSAVNRLEYELGGAYNYAATHFGGFNLYMHAATKNVHFAKQIGASSAYSLRRTPPDAMADAV